MAAPPPPPPPPDPSVLMDELVEDFLLRLPLDDPELLARAALVSRQWYRVVTGASFRRRFRELHRSTPPLLGYVLNLADSIRFVPLSSFRPPDAHAHRGGVRAVSSSHGRVLLHRLFEGDLIAPRPPLRDLDVFLSVWHPITGEQQDLPVVPLRPNRALNMANWDAAVVCAGGDGCDHLRCHFIVVFVGKRDGRNFSCFYSSEAGGWSDPVISPGEVDNGFVPGNFILIGTDLYTTCAASNEIFKYDLQTHQMSNISITAGPGVQLGNMGIGHTRLLAAEDGRLGFAKASNSELALWLRENGILEENRTIDLPTLLPADAMPDPVLQPYEAVLAKPWVIAFAQTGAGVIFLWTRVGYFSVDLESGSCKRVGDVSSDRVVPYVNFCTPAPGAISTVDRPGAGVAMPTDEVPVADNAVSTDEGPGAGVVVSADEESVADIAGSTDEEPGAGVAVSADE